MKKNKFFLAGLPVIALAFGLMVEGCASAPKGTGDPTPQKIRDLEQNPPAGTLVGSGVYEGGSYDFAKDMATMQARSKIAQQISAMVSSKMADVTGAVEGSGVNNAGGRVVTQISQANLPGTKVLYSEITTVRGKTVTWVIVGYNTEAAKKLVADTISASDLSAAQKRAMGTKEFIDAMFP